ncbi:MAG: phage tail tape measure protein [Coprobacillus cateniformis]|nr:MAG TPA: minor tail protein [Caudoviricetes sp.]
MSNQLGINLKVEIDKNSSDESIKRYLDNVQKNKTLDIKIDTNSLAEQIKNLSNVSFDFDSNGVLKGLTSQIKSENGEILKIKQQLNDANEFEVRSAQIVNSTQKQREQQEKLILSHKQKQREISLAINKLLSGKNGEHLTSTELKRLQELQRTFKSLNATNMSQLNSALKDTKLSISEIANDANNRRLTTTVDKVNSLGQSLKNLGLYVSGAMIIRELWQQFKTGINYVKELDEAFTDVAISMDITRQEFNEWTKDARKIAQANGQTTTSLMEMVKIYATAGEEISDIQDKLAGTAMIQNITQWNAEQTTSAVNSVVNQYKLLEKEINGTTGNVANAIEYMGDALIGISNKLTIDNVAGIQEMINAIDTAGGIMEQSGASMEWYMAVTGALKETMNATGDEVGNAFKMINC